MQSQRTSLPINPSCYRLLTVPLQLHQPPKLSLIFSLPSKKSSPLSSILKVIGKFLASSILQRLIVPLQPVHCILPTSKHLQSFWSDADDWARSITGPTYRVHTATRGFPTVSYESFRPSTASSVPERASTFFYFLAATDGIRPATFKYQFPSTSNNGR